MQRDDFYIYALFRETGVPFYIGKGRRHRMFRHEDAALRSKGTQIYRHAVIRSMLRRGHEVPKVMLREGLTEAVAFEYERTLIAAIGRADLGLGPLANLTDGGDGPAGRKMTPEQLKRHRERPRRKHTPEAIEKIRLGQLGKKKSAAAIEKTRAAFIGRKQTPEHREKIRLARADWRPSAEHAERLRQACIGREVSPEAREKIRLRMLGSQPSEEAREKMRAARLGRKLPPETIEKIRAAITGRRHSPEAIERMRGPKRKVVGDDLPEIVGEERLAAG